MSRILKDVVGASFFHYLPQVHHRHPIAEVVHHRQVVAYEEIGEAEVVLEGDEKLEDLRLDGNVQGAHRLVENENLRVRGQRPGYADALRLAP